MWASMPGPRRLRFASKATGPRRAPAISGSMDTGDTGPTATSGIRDAGIALRAGVAAGKMAVGSAAATATVGMTAAGANTDEAGHLRLARTWARRPGRSRAKCRLKPRRPRRRRNKHNKAGSKRTAHANDDRDCHRRPKRRTLREDRDRGAGGGSDTNTVRRAPWEGSRYAGETLGRHPGRWRRVPSPPARMTPQRFPRVAGALPWGATDSIGITPASRPTITVFSERPSLGSSVTISVIIGMRRPFRARLVVLVTPSPWPSWFQSALGATSSRPARPCTASRKRPASSVL